MIDDFTTSAPVAQLGGAKRKNGHKATCSCHICENMKNKAKRGGYEDDVEKERIKSMGGSKKKNGHKPNCSCPICKNMKHAKKGGDDDDEFDKQYGSEFAYKGGKRGKKSNGHKATCGCPICKNMKKKGKKGGQDPDIENQLGDLEEGGIKGQKSNIVPMSSKPEQATSTGAMSTAATTGKVVTASDSEYDEMDAAEKGERGPNIVGGTRKRRGNGHKATCKCPICKNMKKKTRRHRKRSHRRR
jgi:hypothetical protein